MRSVKHNCQYTLYAGPFQWICGLDPIRKTSGYTNTCAATSESFSHHQNYKKNVKNAKISPGRHDHRHSLHAGNNRFVGGETNTISFFVRVQ